LKCYNTFKEKKECFKNRINIYTNIKTWYLKFYLSKTRFEDREKRKMDIKKMQEKLNKKMGGGVQMSFIQDGMASVDLMFEGPRLRTLGYDALDNKKFREARTHFTEAVQLTERALGPNCWQLVPSLTGLCEAYIGLADMVAKRRHGRQTRAQTRYRRQGPGEHSDH
jgi:hypothetical protein